MSRVHVSFAVKERDSSRTVLYVVSPDFSERGTEKEVIGELILDVEAGEFRFSPASKLASSFCPPEYFEKYLADIEKVEQVCEQEGLMCTPWSYRIYRKAKEVLECEISDDIGDAREGIS